jgi:hypothetical protein
VWDWDLVWHLYKIFLPAVVAIIMVIVTVVVVAYGVLLLGAWLVEGYDKITERKRNGRCIRNRRDRHEG